MEISSVDNPKWYLDKDSLGKFHKNLIEWGQSNFRSFPWRTTDQAYHVLIAEIMLHRTQANQVVPIYKEFIKNFPDIYTVSKSKTDELHNIMHPLGLHWRVEKLQETARIIHDDYHGYIPRCRDDLYNLPGIGDYIANAVLCFGWGKAEIIMDTNTIRIFGRLFGLDILPSSRRNRQYKKMHSILLLETNPAQYNYAILDLASEICTIKNEPECDQCPLIGFCVFGSINLDRRS